MKKLFLTLILVLFVIPFGMSQELPSYVPTNGLVAYYPFNGNANDVSGNGYHGTVNGATLTPDRNDVQNSSYGFDGLDDYISINSNYNQLDFFGNCCITISAWIKLDNNDNQYGILTNSDYNNIHQQYALKVDSNSKLYFLAGDKLFESNGINYSSSNINNGQWTHTLVSYDGNKLKLYLNGNLDYENQIIDNFPESPSSVAFIGNSWGANNDFFPGQIDDVGIWNRALTEQEIQNLYTSSTGDIILNGVVSAENNQIKNIADPTDHKDAVTKSYLQAKIDELILRIENIENGVIPDSPIVFSLGIDSVSGYSTPGNTVTAYAINGDILGTAIAQIKSFSNYMILDDFTDRVPTGTNYEKLTYYDTYTDAGSIDGSRFEINRLTTDYGGGILFYGTLELNSQDDKNVFRLSDSDGLPFKFNSFYLDQLESNGTYNFTEFSGTADPGQTVEIYIGGNLFNSTVSDENGEWNIPFDNIPEGSNSIEIIGGVHYGPSLKVTFDNSHEVIFRKELSSIFSFDGDTNLEFFEGFDTSGTKSFNIDNVEWVDFESHYTKAKITDINLDQIDSNFDVSFAPQQTSGSSVLLSSTDEYGTESDKVGVTID